MRTLKTSTICLEETAKYAPSTLKNFGAILHARLFNQNLVFFLLVTVGENVQVVKNGVTYNAVELNISVSQNTMQNIWIMQ